MTWLATTADGATDLVRVFGLRPEAYARWRELYGTLWNPAALDPMLLELCRLRIDDLLGAAAERAVRRDLPGIGAKVAALAAWPTAPVFTARERLCLAFAEQYVLDPHGVTDDAFAALRAHLDPPAIASLTLALAVFDALTRFRLALGLRDGVAPQLP